MDLLPLTGVGTSTHGADRGTALEYLPGTRTTHTPCTPSRGSVARPTPHAGGLYFTGTPRCRSRGGPRERHSRRGHQRHTPGTAQDPTSRRTLWTGPQIPSVTTGPNEDVDLYLGVPSPSFGTEPLPGRRRQPRSTHGGLRALTKHLLSNRLHCSCNGARRDICVDLRHRRNGPRASHRHCGPRDLTRKSGVHVPEGVDRGPERVAPLRGLWRVDPNNPFLHRSADIGPPTTPRRLVSPERHCSPLASAAPQEELTNVKFRVGLNERQRDTSPARAPGPLVRNLPLRRAQKTGTPNTRATLAPHGRRDHWCAISR